MSYNSITQNTVGIITGEYDYHTPPVNFNNIYANVEYNMQDTGPANTDAANNWWGTTDTSVIDVKNYDGKDDVLLGLIEYQPILATPVDISTPTPTPTPTPTRAARPQVVIAVDYNKSNPANAVEINWRLIPGINSYAVDGYMGVKLPDGVMYIYDGEKFRRQAHPIMTDFRVYNYSSGKLGPFALADELPSGTYTLYAVLADSGKSPWTQGNWISNLASCSSDLTH